MQSATFTDNARISSDGQIKIPKDVREVLGVPNGGMVTFIVEGDEIKIANPFLYALKEIQEEMKGAAEEAGLKSEEDVVALVKEIRSENNTPSPQAALSPLSGGALLQE